MNTRKKTTFIIVTVVAVALIATATAILLHTFLSHTQEQSATSANELLKKQADTAFKNGVDKENKGSAADALKYYEEAYTYYKKLGDNAQIASLTLKINYMKKILEATGQKVDLTVDTSTQATNSGSSTTTDTGNKSTPLPTGSTDVGTAPVVPSKPAPDTTGTPATPTP